jgi:transposase
MSYICGEDRQQAMLLPATIDQYVGEDHPVRVIEAFAAGLDLEALGFARSQPAETGRRPYDPRDLLQLYLWGYLNRVTSSRRLQKECGRNLELFWLLRLLQPDFRTISDFRKANAAPIKRVFREFVLLCRKMGLYGQELVAIDGTKLKASNFTGRRATAEQLAEKIRALDEQIDRYLADLEQNDQDLPEEEASPSKGPESEAQLDKMYRQREQWTRAQAVAEESGQKAPLTDPDSQSMCGVGLGYNAQLAVDDKHHLIVAAELAEEATDHRQLPVMAAVVAEVLGPRVKMVADAGYHDQMAVAAAEEAGHECYVPRPLKGGAVASGIYPKTAFVYDAEKDCYRCPAGQELTRHGKDYLKHGLIYHGYAHRQACRQCPVRRQCTEGQYRRVQRWEKEALMEAVAQRTENHPEIVRRRKALVEHPFGTIKFWWGQAAVLTRGRLQVQAELSFSALAYNLRRILNLMGVKPLLEAMATAQKAGFRLTRALGRPFRRSEHTTESFTGRARRLQASSWLTTIAVADFSPS